MRRLAATLTVFAGCLALLACSTTGGTPPRFPPGSPYDEAAWTRTRNERVWAAASECQRRYPSIELVTMSEQGGVHYRYDEATAEEKLFSACLDVKIEELLHGAPGRLLAAPGAAGRTSLPVESRNGRLVVRVEVQGAAATMILDTGASKTAVKPDLAARAGLTLRETDLPIRLVLADGRTIAAPLARVGVIRLGEARVGDLDVAVYEVLPDERSVDGLLGEDVLRFFRVTLDRTERRLLLEPSP